MFEFLNKVTEFLGRGKYWVVNGITIYLWPFVALAIFIGIILIVDKVLY